MITFHTTMHRDEIIDTLNTYLEPDLDPNRGQDLTVYYENLAHIFSRANDKADSAELYAVLSFATILAFAPRVHQRIPEDLPLDERNTILLERMKHAPQYPDMITEDDMSWIASFQSLFSTIVYIVGDDQAFTEDFVTYTQTPIQYDEEEEEHVTV